jgi:ubiquitin-conjugating enzyme E2 T
MASAPARLARVRKELEQLSRDPPPGVAAWPADGALDAVQAVVQGPEGSPYEGGSFRLQLSLPTRYPFEPPAVRFVTKVYHPNIDPVGRICLDSLKLPPAGQWQPSLNIAQVLSQVRLLLAEPNADDPLMPDISDLFRSDRPRFDRVARQHTRAHAFASPIVAPQPATGAARPHALSPETVTLTSTAAAIPVATTIAAAAPAAAAAATATATATAVIVATARAPASAPAEDAKENSAPPAQTQLSGQGERGAQPRREPRDEKCAACASVASTTSVACAACADLASCTAAARKRAAIATVPPRGPHQPHSPGRHDGAPPAAKAARAAHYDSL